MRSQVILACLALALTSCSGAVITSTPIASSPQPTENTNLLGEFVCTAVSSAEGPSDLSNSPLSQLSETDWVRGPEDAPATFITYGDYQCPLCAQLALTLKHLEEKYPDGLQEIHRHFPLIGAPDQVINDKAAISMQAAEAAGKQGKFWEMHDALFATQAEWTGMNRDEFEAWLNSTAVSLGLDQAQFIQDLQSDELIQKAQEAWTNGQALGIGSPPFVLVNGEPYTGPLDEASLELIVQLGLLTKRQFHECPPMILEPGTSYTATLHTEKGDIVIELFPQVAPMAVDNFVFLAEHDWFDNVTFHRVLPGFVAQSGDPTGTGFGNPGYTFAIEVTPDLSFDRAGLVAMANSGPTSNGSQFFITLGPAEHLNGQYTIFGEVIQGMDVVESLTPRDPGQANGLPPGDLILDVSIETH